MSRRRWLWLGPPLAILIGAVGLSRFGPGAEAGPKGTPLAAGACAGTPLVRDAAGRMPRGKGQGAWWRLTDKLDANGAMAGRGLALGVGGGSRFNLELATETLASGPVGGLVALTTSDDTASEVRLISVDEACSWTVHHTSDIARGAILDPRDGSVIVHLLARESRADLGTWRIPAEGGAPVLVLGPLAEGVVGERVFSTDYRLDGSSALLAVQSCSDTDCVTRIVDLANPATSPVTLDQDQGQAIGFAGSRLVTWSKCAGLPCSIEAWDLAAGTSQVIVDRAESAGVTDDGSFLVAVKDAARGRVIRVAVDRAEEAFIKGVGRNERVIPGGFGGFVGYQGGLDEIAIATQNGNPHSFRPAAAEVIR
jgi:hypothetical protein